MAQKFDVAVLGGGNGGYAAALRAAQLGLSTAIVERDKVGGTCLHRGCIPTKAMLHSAEVADTVRRASAFGVAGGDPQVDHAGVARHRDAVVAKHYKGLQGLIRSRKVTTISGEGRLAGQGRIEVAGAGPVEAGAVILASGSKVRNLPFIDMDHEVFIDSDDALRRTDAPESLIVIGAGAVGLEFASIYRSFGAEVTVVEALERLAPGEDADVSRELARSFKKRGIRCLAGTRVTGASVAGGHAEVVVEKDGSEPEMLRARTCLVAAGRGPVSEGLGYEEAGVRLEKGFVVADGSCRTGVEGVWAVGDLITQPELGLPFAHFQLAHVAFAEGIHVAEQIAGVPTAPVDYLSVPRCTYSYPEMASAGLTEDQARASGMEVETASFPWAASGKAAILGETGGFVKVVAEKGGRVMGVHMIGPRVTELVAEAQLITAWEAYPEEVAALVHPHPTLTEGIGEAMLSLAGKKLHGA